jgi:hypothetical protein
MSHCIVREDTSSNNIGMPGSAGKLATAKTPSTAGMTAIAETPAKGTPTKKGTQQQLEHQELKGRQQ